MYNAFLDMLRTISFYAVMSVVVIILIGMMAAFKIFNVEDVLDKDIIV